MTSTWIIFIPSLLVMCYWVAYCLRRTYLKKLKKDYNRERVNNLRDYNRARLPEEIRQEIYGNVRFYTVEEYSNLEKNKQKKEVDFEEFKKEDGYV